MKNPRWINEIPKPIPINEKIEITEEGKKRQKNFQKQLKMVKLMNGLIKNKILYYSTKFDLKI